MIALRRGFNCIRQPAAFCVVAALLTPLLPPSARAINILVDYRYDTNNFFNTQEKRSAIEAAAARYSAIITTSLSAVTLANDNVDPRIGFTHPGTGNTFEVSPATTSASDQLFTTGVASAANEYRGPWSIAADQWILYAGGRSLSTGMTSIGGTGTGSNLSTVFTNGASHLNRGFRLSGSPTVPNLPVWGGSVAFDDDGSTVWHFNHTTAPPTNTSDLYSFALHEIGHVLGLNTSSWIEWTSLSPSNQFTGPQAVAAYNGDNGAALTALTEQSTTDNHWRNNMYGSLIFQNASPNFVDTVGSGVLQDLLMEPALEKSIRLELTNVDVAALRDVGWSTMAQPLVQPGDFNGNGAVDAADYVPLSKGLASGTYATWKANFGETLAPAGATADLSNVPEPALVAILAVMCVVFFASPRKNARSRLKRTGA